MVGVLVQVVMKMVRLRRTGRHMPQMRVHQVRIAMLRQESTTHRRGAGIQIARVMMVRWTVMRVVEATGQRSTLLSRCRAKSNPMLGLEVSQDVRLGLLLLMMMMMMMRMGMRMVMRMVMGAGDLWERLQRMRCAGQAAAARHREVIRQLGAARATASRSHIIRQTRVRDNRRRGRRGRTTSGLELMAASTGCHRQSAGGREKPIWRGGGRRACPIASGASPGTAGAPVDLGTFVVIGDHDRRSHGRRDKATLMITENEDQATSGDGEGACVCVCVLEGHAAPEGRSWIKGRQKDEKRTNNQSTPDGDASNK